MPDDLSTDSALAGIEQTAAVIDGAAPRASLALVEQAIRDVDDALAGTRAANGSGATEALRRRRRELEDTLVRLRAGLAAHGARAPRSRNGRKNRRGNGKGFSS